MFMYNIGIVAVAYNRVNSLKRLLKSISLANYDGESSVDLIISIDKSKTDDVEVFADTFQWPFGQKVVDKHSKNLGLKQHMLSLGKWFDIYDAIIVLEDDLVVSRNYFNYVRQCVEKYYEVPDIAGISLYSFRTNYQNGLPFEPLYNGTDVYFMQCAMSWGEVWMKDQWSIFYEWYLRHQTFDESPLVPRAFYNWGEKSWLKFHSRYCIEAEKFFVFPYHSYVTNFSDEGENHQHNSGTNETVYQVPLVRGLLKPLILNDLNEDQSVKYDGFFENLNVIEHLHFSQENLCVDLYGLKNINPKKRFILSTQLLDYKIVKSYAISYKPLIENVYQEMDGKGIYLYDTSEIVKNESKNNRTHLMLYYFNISNIVRFVISYKLSNIVKAFIHSLLNRIKHL